MPDRLPLLLPTARSGIRPKSGRRGRNRVQGPPHDRQVSRVEPQLRQITDALNAATISAHPQALEPETILVLEIAGEVTNFARAMNKIQGFEFLGEQALEQLDPDEDFKAVDQQGRPKRYGRQLFLIASNARAWRRLLELWEQFRRGTPLPDGYTPFRDLFSQLRELREWNDRDRLERAGAADAWLRDLRDRGNELVPFEAELWRRSSARHRAGVLATLQRELARNGGRVDRDVLIEEIDYHGVLGYVPASRLLEAAASREVGWLTTQGIRLFHPTGQMVAPVHDAGEQADRPRELGPLPADRPPRIALLDGLPVPSHVALDGRIRVDDPDDLASDVPVTRRRHGTLMASLVVNGDVGAAARPLAHPVYVRPILRPDPRAWFDGAPEVLPPDELPVDVVNRAVVRLFEGDEPAAPDTRVIVFAIGDTAQQFDKFISPLARLLDWLAWKYGVLFLVSAGNHTADLLVPADFDTSNPAELEHEVVDALRRTALSRRLLAPGEAVNALTISAAHTDASSTPLAGGLLDPIQDSDLPNVVSPIASGVNRSIKPDLMLPGGRQPVREEPRVDGEPRRLSLAISLRPPGLRVAAPGVNGELDRFVHATGTSCAAGFAGHEAGALLERLDELREIYANEFPDSQFDAVLVKAALAHTARWGSAETTVRRVLQDAGERGTRAQVARFLGHGRAEPRRALIADDHRAVLLQAGRLTAEEVHAYDLPVPMCLAGERLMRRLSLTLAWLTPLRPRHRAYRASRLELTYASGNGSMYGSRQEVDNHAAGRGTLQHEILMNGRAVPAAPGDTTALEISCRPTTGTLDDEIPYALLVTVESPAELQLPIYDEIRQAIGVRARVSAQ